MVLKRADFSNGENADNTADVKEESVEKADDSDGEQRYKIVTIHQMNTGMRFISNLCVSTIYKS